MRPAISWTQNETAKMLAYLDIAVDANSVHEKRNQIAILRQIEKSMNYKRGPGQIQGRLQSLWRANGRKGYPRLCFEQGSEALQLRHSTLGKMVQKERDRLKRKGEVSSQYQCAQPPHAHSFNSLPDGLEVADSSGSEPITYETDHPPTDTNPTDVDSIDNTAPLASNDTIIDDTIGAAKSKIPVLPMRKRQGSQNNNEDAMESTTTRWGVKIPPFARDPTKSFTTRVEVRIPPFPHNDLDAFSEKTAFQKGLEIIGSEHKKMRQEVEHLKEKMRCNKQAITNLSRERQHFAKPYQLLIRKSGDHIDFSKVNSIFQLMQRGFDALWSFPDFCYPNNRNPIARSKTTEQLIKRIYDIDDFAIMYLRWRKCSHPATVVVQSFIGAAITEWIFNTELDFVKKMYAPMVDQYRNIVKSLCGEDAWRNLDSAAFRSLIDGNIFQEASHEAVKGFTDELVKCLRPFVKESRRRESTPAISKHLAVILEYAVQIKTELMVWTCKMESIFPAVGAAVDKNTMLVERKDTEEEMVIGEETTVGLPTVPGLRIEVPEYLHLDLLVDTEGHEAEKENRVRTWSAKVVT